jgi:GAF domain-containing protein/ActR/RegA family two-component response regulator
MTELEQQVARLRTLARLNRLVSSSLDINTILGEIARAAAALTGAEVVSLWVADGQTQTLELRAFSNEVMGADHPRRRMRFGEGGAGWVAIHRRPLAISDPWDDDRLVARSWFREHGLRSFHAVPIIHEDSLLGVLALLGREPFDFEPDDQDLLESFVAQAAVAIRNARLFDESESRRRIAEAVAEVGQFLSQTFDPDLVAHRIAESMCRLLDARSSAVYRLDPVSRDLVLQAVSSNLGRTFLWTSPLAPGAGLGALALRDRRPAASPDVLHDPDIVYTAEARAALADATHRAVLTVPLLVQDSAFGTITIGDRTGRVFTREEMQVAQAFANQAALALENARLFDETEQRRREAEVLAALSAEINASLNLSAILERVAEGARDLCRADAAAIALREPDTENFFALYRRGANSLEHITDPITPGKGAGGLVLATGRPFRTENYAEDPRITKDYLEWVVRDGIVAEMVVPIRCDGHIEGLLYVQNFSPRPFSDRNEAVLSRLADHAAIAIKNARLYEETERRRRAAESLAEVGRLITESLDPREVGQRIVESVCRLVNARMAAFYQIAPHTGDLVLLAGTEEAIGWNNVVPKGTAATGLAVSEGRPIVTSNVLDDPRITLVPEMRARIERADFRAVLALPLIAGGRVIGGLTVGAEAGRVFLAEDVALAQSFADQAALAIENARLYAEATRRRWEAEILGDVGRLFSGSLGADEVAQRIANSLRALLGAEASLVCRLDPGSGDLLGCSQSGDALDRNVVFPSGTGAIGVAVRERRPIVTPNLLTDPRVTLTPELRARIEAASYRSVLAVPLLVNDTVIGALSIGDREGRTFSDDDIRLARTFADHAAMALENARLLEDATQRRREAELVASLAQQINASLDLDAILARVSEAARDLCRADLAWIALSDRDTGAMLLRHWPGARGSGYEGIRIEPGKGIGGQVLLTGRPFRTDDYAEDPRIAKDYLGIVDQEGIVTALVVPIQTEGRIEGLLYAENRTPHPFTPQDEAILVRLAEHAAIAIGNGRLLADQKTRQARLEALLDVSSQLAQIQPVESLLDAITRACGQVLATSSVGFRLVEGDDLVIAGTWGDAREAMPTARLKIGESLSGLVAASGAPLVVNDVRDDPRVIPAHRETINRLGYRAWLGVPVKIGERVIGVFSARTRREGGFSKEDQAVATAFASQAAAALENSRLFQEVRQAYTEVSRAQGDLMQAQKMEAIGRLAGGMAHDFNNLLTVVHGRSEILLRRLGADPKSRSDVEAIQHTAVRAAALTRQLLAFSRKQVLQPMVLSLNSAVTDAAAMFRRLIGEDINLVVIPGAGLDRVKADPTQLEQILINLAVNARDAMPRGGRLVIETADVELGEAFVGKHPGSRPGPHVVLSVTDSGVGISPEVQAHIFEPFFTTKEKGKGTGLGLATVYGIVKQHEGYIGVQSAPGRGATFSIYLPRVEEVQDPPATQRAAAGAPGGSETILLVEDEDEVRELAREILEMNGYTVLDAASGAEALRVCRQRQDPIHLLLTDVVMPGMSGPELARQAEALRPEAKVVYVSGYTDDALGRHGVLEPGIILLAKPFTPDSLLGAVRGALGSRRA